MKWGEFSIKSIAYGYRRFSQLIPKKANMVGALLRAKHQMGLDPSKDRQVEDVQSTNPFSSGWLGSS